MATYKSPKRTKNPDTPEFTSKYYITNSALLPEVLASKKDGKMNDKLATMLMMLARKYANRPSFIGYSYKEDMISEALTNLVQNALKFNPEKSSNPFAYYTTCINSSFLQYLNFEKKHRKIRDELLIEIGENPSFGFQEEYRQQHEAGGEYKAEMNEMVNEIVDAKERIRLEAIYQAKKAAQLEAEQAALLAAADSLMIDGDVEESEFVDSLNEKELESSSLLEFETTFDADDQSDDS